MNKVVADVIRLGGSGATRGMVCDKCGCRKQNMVTFTDGTPGYACVWNNHPTYVVGRSGSARKV